MSDRAFSPVKSGSAAERPRDNDEAVHDANIVQHVMSFE